MIAIEYIGPTPKKKPKKPILGGWIILCLAALFVGYFAWPHFGPVVVASQIKVGTTEVTQTVQQLTEAGTRGDLFAAAALKRTELEIDYDEAYYRIDYPMGDIPSNKGIAADTIVRSYREIGVDLQELLIEDMRSNYRAYPQLWGQQEADPCIDHRRNLNLKRFFQRNATELDISRSQQSFQPGDIIFWELPHGPTHTGVVVPGPTHQKSKPWIVHNIGEGPVWQNALFHYKIVGHFRF